MGMRAEKIFDISQELNKRFNKAYSFYWLLQQIFETEDFNVLEDNVRFTHMSAIDGMTAEFLSNAFKDHYAGVDSFNRLVPDELEIIRQNFRAYDERTGEVKSDFSDTNRLNIALYSFAPYIHWCNTSKTVYTLSRGLATSLKEQVEDTIDIYINFDSIAHLPHRVFYLDLKAGGLKNMPGAFVEVIPYETTCIVYASVWDSEYNNLTSLMARFRRDPDTGLIHIDKNEENITNLGKDNRDYMGMYTLLLSTLAYMGSVDADVVEVVERTTKNPRKGAKKVEKKSEYQIGYRVGQKLEEARKRYRYLSDHHDGSTKRPHIRKAHWHTFWTGKKNSNDRKQVVKWVAETYINCDSAEMIDIVDRLVEKGNEGR